MVTDKRGHHRTLCVCPRFYYLNMHLVDLHVPPTCLAWIWTPDLQGLTATQAIHTAVQWLVPLSREGRPMCRNQLSQLLICWYELLGMFNVNSFVTNEKGICWWTVVTFVLFCTVSDITGLQCCTHDELCKFMHKINTTFWLHFYSMDLPCSWLSVELAYLCAFVIFSLPFTRSYLCKDHICCFRA